MLPGAGAQQWYLWNSTATVGAGGRVELALDGLGAVGEGQPIVHDALAGERAHLGRRVRDGRHEGALEERGDRGEHVDGPVLQRVQQAHAARVAHRHVPRLGEGGGEPGGGGYAHWSSQLASQFPSQEPSHMLQL